MQRRFQNVLTKGFSLQLLILTASSVFLFGCDSMVSDWIGGGRFSSNPSGPAATTTDPSLKLSGLPTSTPDGYPISGTATLENATSAVTYSVINDSCSGVEINSTTGTVSGVVGGTVGNTCTYQIRATSNSKQYDSAIQSVAVTAGFTVSFAKPMIGLNKGDAPVTVNLILSTAAPFNTYLKYKLYSLNNVPTAMYGFGATGTIYVPAGATQVPLTFELKSNSVLSGVDLQTLQIEDGGSTPLPSLSINLAAVAAPAFSKISVGTTHSCGIASGKLYCWGNNTASALGDPAILGSVSKPTQIGSSTTWQQISAGYNHTCGINAGALYCWGDDSTLQIGNGAATGYVTAPLQIGSSTTWQLISAGYSHTCGIDAGKLFCWGNSGSGQVGYGGTSTTLVDAPLQIGAATNWQKISAGRSATCGIESGILYCWGGDGNGQQGNGAGSGNVLTPTQIGVLTNWQDISLSKSGTYTVEHACGIAGGALYCWGDDTYGEMGNGAGTAQVNAPQQIGTSTTWTQVSGGNVHRCGVDAGKLYCWGNNDYGIAGVGITIDTTLAPTQVGTDSDWTSAEAGGNVSCGIRNNILNCWGGQSNNAAGRGSVGNWMITEPTSSYVGSSSNWQSVGGTGNSICGVDSGRLYCWGLGTNGVLGNGINDVNFMIAAPAQIGKTAQWQYVSRGSSTLCAISSGQLYCWGQNNVGQVGIGSTATPITTPNRVGTLSDWTSVSVGSNYACGIAGGKLYCWGNDFWGTLGNGGASTGNVLSPQQVGSSTTWQAVAAGGTHACGIDAGQLYCWGDDTYGAVGNGATTGTIDAPALIDASTTWQKVSAGGDASCAIKAGALYCWGRDNNGQQGNGAGASNVLIPTQVGASTTWQDISTGLTTCGIDAGALYCWGSDSFGQVGNGPATGTNVTTPSQVGALTTWQKIFTLGTSTCGVIGGKLSCWGSNLYLQLGIYSSSGFPQPLIDF